MLIQDNLSVQEKLKILTAAAKYDVSCTSSGVNRKGKAGSMGNASEMGICHSFSADGRCISLLKVLMTNVCAYDCQYCVNRRSNDLPRAAFTPEELCELTMGFYRRNYIEGLFLSSGVLVSPDYTTELLIRTLSILREKYRFGGYIHAYKFDEGVRDGVILDLRYEARDIPQDLNSQERVDAWFDAKTAQLTPRAKAKLKARWGTLQKVFSSRSRLEGAK